VYRDEALSRTAEYLETFENARQLKDQITAVERILKDLNEFEGHTESLQAVLLVIEDAAYKHTKLATAEAFTLLAQRDELRERVPALKSGQNAPELHRLIVEEQRSLVPVLEEIPAAKLRRAVSALREAFPEEWPAKALYLLSRGSPRLVAEAARLLQENNRLQDLHTALDRSIRDHSITSAAALWLCEKKDKKARGGEFASLIHPRLMSAMFTAMERDQFNENRDRKLHDLLVNDQELVPDLISGATVEEAREAMRKLLTTPVFEDLNKRSLLGRFVRKFPELEAMITGGREDKQESLIVSWESLEKRQAEFEDVVSKKIPENTKEIAIAREYGDLRENFEFKAAKEMQRVLMRRKQEMERDLAMARGTDFANPDTQQVSIGTSVTVRGCDDGRTDTYHILGAWDTDPEKHIVSYKAVMAQSLLGHKAGETVAVPTEAQERRVEIIRIEPWRKDAAASSK
jgi:transcription elongation GreA/GreB family factor